MNEATTTLTRAGVRGSVAARFFRKSPIRVHASGGFQSMKKQGPPPWGMNQVGILELAFSDVFDILLFPSDLKCDLCKVYVVDELPHHPQVCDERPSGTHLLTRNPHQARITVSP